ncbi:unnamed protein product, partial [Scytosiphon promiscuus]
FPLHAACCVPPPPLDFPSENVQGIPLAMCYTSYDATVTHQYLTPTMVRLQRCATNETHSVSKKIDMTAHSSNILKQEQHNFNIQPKIIRQNKHTRVRTVYCKEVTS